MQRQYLGQAPFLVGLSLLVEIVQPFFSKPWTPFWTAILLARRCGLWRGFPIQEWECRTDQRIPSAGLFEPLYSASFVMRNSGQLREEHHLREARVIRPNHISNPLQLCFHDECFNAWHVASAQRCACAWPCEGNGGETEQGRDNNCLVHLQLSAYCDDSLCPYSCPQPANGSTCYSQSVWHFFVPELSWTHCASEEQILLQGAATLLLSAGLRSKALAAVQWQVCFIQGCTAVMEGDASICGGEWRKQRGSEREGEKSWNQDTALFDAIGDREGITHKSFFPLCQPSFQQGETWWCWQISVDSQAWGVMANRPSRLTVSKALVGSTKRMYRFWFCSLTFPGSLLLTAEIMSIVSLFLLKPPCWLSETKSSN